MFTKRNLFALGLGGAATLTASRLLGGRDVAVAAGKKGPFEIVKSDSEWREQLTEMQYYVLREDGTERPFTSPLNDENASALFIVERTGEGAFRTLLAQHFVGRGRQAPFPGLFREVGPDLVSPIGEIRRKARRVGVAKRE